MTRRTWKLESKMVAWTSLLIFMVVLMIGTYVYSILVTTIENQVGKRALSVAQVVAEMPEIKEAFSQKQPWRIIQPIAEKIRKQTGAKYIVVGNRQGVRYSHPLAERIGKKMVGGDNSPALQGKSYISKATGSLGPALRGKVPIKNQQGHIIGIVSVGFLSHDIDEIILDNLADILMILLIIFLLGTLCAFFIAKYIKQLIFGLEPNEISALFRERNAVLESVREGIISINPIGKITMINQVAMDILEIPPHQSVLGESIQSILPNTRMLHVLAKKGEPELDREMRIHDKEIIVNRLPIIDQNRILGVVSSFRLKSELDQLNLQLSQVKQYVEALRAQTHEYKNTLYTISGLIQLESYQEALHLIHEESTSHQDHIGWVMDHFADPWLGAILIGFYNRARELKVNLVIDKKSRLSHLPSSLPSSSLVTILGNLITNALEAVQNQITPKPQVNLSIFEETDQLTFIVADNGKGIPNDDIKRIYHSGFTTKQTDPHTTRGYGLSNVLQLVQEQQGSINVDKSSLSGACFTVTLPISEEVSR
ncbi:two-component system, CitB family, sensor kinase [Marininema mesophilum]|uniref:histidine kinase n=1 Tax=Marininema mesophilum TaxID=1048340 RepID=A0A1H2YL15_9BACL|nr:sensor histidine kinase [Marininema mesophilum]SDX05695.1 two-component system, CitB family, sensor kinase [Marininema mesophilum]